MNYPRAILAGFTVVVILGLLVAGSTSGGAFGSYNPAWDGTSEFRSMATDSDRELSIGRNTTVYENVEANGTVAVILSPEESYSDSERQSIQQFVDSGGTLLVAEDVGPNGNQLLRAIGSAARFDGATLRDERNYENGPALPVARTVELRNSSAETVVLNHGTAIRTNETVGVDGVDAPMEAVNATNMTVLAASSSYAYLDRNGNEALDNDETVARYPVITVERIGEGRVIAVSDPSIFINAMLDQGDNRAVARTLLMGHDHVVLDVSHAGALPPLQALVLTLQESSLLQALVGSLLVVLFTYRAALMGKIVSLRDRFGQGEPTLQPRDRDTVIRGVKNRHPEWNSDRVERVTQAIMTRQTERDGND